MKKKLLAWTECDSPVDREKKEITQLPKVMVMEVQRLKGNNTWEGEGCIRF